MLGTASFVDTDLPETVEVHIPFDISAKSFQFKLETTGQMEFIGMVFIEFEIVGAR